jgi:hypothetical protein
MTLHTPVDDIGDPAVRLAGALELYDMAAEILGRLLHEARHAGTPDCREIMIYTKELRDSLKLVLNERASVEKLRADCGGPAGDRTLDFDAARDEIGRRLACLRNAGDG